MKRTKKDSKKSGHTQPRVIFSIFRNWQPTHATSKAQLAPHIMQKHKHTKNTRHSSPPRRCTSIVTQKIICSFSPPLHLHHCTKKSFTALLLSSSPFAPALSCFGADTTSNNNNHNHDDGHRHHDHHLAGGNNGGGNNDTTSSSDNGNNNNDGLTKWNVLTLRNLA